MKTGKLRNKNGKKLKREDKGGKRKQNIIDGERKGDK